MLDQLLAALKNKACKRKIVATHKMTEPQKKLWKEFVTAREKAKVAEKVADTLKKKLWNKIEGDLNDFDRDMKVNDEDMTIEVFEDDCDNCEHNEE